MSILLSFVFLLAVCLSNNHVNGCEYLGAFFWNNFLPLLFSGIFGDIKGSFFLKFSGKSETFEAPNSPDCRAEDFADFAEKLFPNRLLLILSIFTSKVSLLPVQDKSPKRTHPQGISTTEKLLFLMQITLIR